jgi:hypothetical protein
VNFGSTGAGAHEPVEWVDLDTVVQVAHALTHAGRDYLAHHPVALATSAD